MFSCCFKNQKSSSSTEENLSRISVNRNNSITSTFFREISPYTKKKKCTKICAKIDTRPPTVRSNILKPIFNALRTDQKVIVQRQKENQDLLRKIIAIYQSKGKTYNYDTKKEPKRIDKNGIQKEYERCSVDRANKHLYEKIRDVKPAICTFDKSGFKVAKYPINVSKICSSLPNLEQRTIVFMDISLESPSITVGRLTIELYDDIVPVVVSNFIDLIKNHVSNSSCSLANQDKSTKPVSYVGCPVYRIFRGLYAETGDVTKGNGTGGESNIVPDNFIVEPKYTGMLGMVSYENPYVDSKFFFTFKPLPILHQKRCFFGRVVKGLQVLGWMEDSCRLNGDPTVSFYISNCGLAK